MRDCLFAEEVAGFVLQLLHQDNVRGIEAWQTLSPIELGVLSWHLGNFYGCPCGDAFSEFLCMRATAARNAVFA